MKEFYFYKKTLRNLLNYHLYDEQRIKFLFKATKPQTFEPKIDSFHANIEATKSQSNISTHQPSQSLNLKNRREEIRKNVEVQKPILTKNNPNMESTTSIHSMQSNLTETEIKRGGGVRKGIIPNSLFD